MYQFAGLFILALATLVALRSPSGPREHEFKFRAFVVLWSLLLVLVGCLRLLPVPYNFIAFIPFFLTWPFGMNWTERKLKEIRASEANREETASA